MRKQKAEPFLITDYELIKNSDLYQKTRLNIKCLLDMDQDSLLYNFRKKAGLDTRGAKPLPGWEAPHMHFRGQFTGHYLTACARASLIIQKNDPDLSTELKERVERIVAGLEECQNELGKREAHPGYLAAVESSMLDDLENLHFTGVFTVVYYCLHKMMCGLLDSYTLIGCKKALDILFSYQFTTVPDKKLWLRCYFQDKGTFVRRQDDKLRFNQCFRFEVEKNGVPEEIAVQSLYEEEGAELTAVYYPVMECEGKIRLRLEGSRYEGVNRGTAKFFHKIELGYFDE